MNHGQLQSIRRQHPGRFGRAAAAVPIMLLWLALSPTGRGAEADGSGRRKEDFLGWKFGLFLHFNVATFNNQEWANGHEDPATFAPERLDCGQWADAAKAAGMRYAVLTVKHTGGWCLWDSEHTAHDATAFKNFRDGKGDVVREFVDAFRARGLKVGFYYCAPGNYDGKYGNTLPEGKASLHGLPPEAAGDFAGFMKRQFTELLTKYGPIDLIWVDQWSNAFTRKDWPMLKAHLQSLQPDCLVIANNAHDDGQTDIHSYELPIFKGKTLADVLPADNTHPSEVCDKIGPGWFWSHARDESRMLAAEEVVARLGLCNERRSNYLLNVAPDRTGRLPDLSVARLREIGKLLAVP